MNIPYSTAINNINHRLDNNVIIPPYSLN
jgi:hypothetical protein